AEDRRKLDADRAAAHDHDRLRHLGQADRFIARDDPLPIDLDPGDASRVRAGGDDDFLFGDEGLLLPFGDLDLALAGGAAAALDPVDLVLLEEQLDSPGEPLDDLVLAGLDLIHVEADGGLADR